MHAFCSCIVKLTIKEPEEAQNAGADQVRLAGLTSERAGRLTAGKVEHVKDVQHGHAAKRVQAPLVRRTDQGADEAGDDHDEIGKDGDHHVRKWQACDQQQFEQEQGRGDGPVDVACVPDRSGDRLDARIVATDILDRDGNSAKVTCHAKVGHTGCCSDHHAEMMKGTLTVFDAELGPNANADGGQGHDRKHHPEKVGGRCRNVNRRHGRIDVQRLVAGTTEDAAFKHDGELVYVCTWMGLVDEGRRFAVRTGLAGYGCLLYKARKGRLVSRHHPPRFCCFSASVHRFGDRCVYHLDSVIHPRDVQSTTECEMT